MEKRVWYEVSPNTLISIDDSNDLLVMMCRERCETSNIPLIEIFRLARESEGISPFHAVAYVYYPDIDAIISALKMIARSLETVIELNNLSDKLEAKEVNYAVKTLLQEVRSLINKFTTARYIIYKAAQVES
jgi:hypothetical protein